MPIRSTPAPYALILIDLVTRAGFPREALLAGTSLANSDVTALGARIPHADFERLVTNAAALTRDPALGLRLGAQLNLSAHAALGQAFMTCETVEGVIDLFLRYYHLLTNELEIRREDAAGVTWLVSALGEHETAPEFVFELFYASFINTLGGLLGHRNFSLVLEFPYPEPPHARRYPAALGTQLRFDAPRSRIGLDRTLLQTRLPSSNPALHALYEAECARLLADLEQETSVAQQTLRLLHKLEGQYPQMPRVAAMLNFSARTYRRRLDAEGVSFQELLDRVRTEHATHHLRHSRLPLSSIAYMIGFRDASNFRRAYLRWTGQTPGEVRSNAART